MKRTGRLAAITLSAVVLLVGCAKAAEKANEKAAEKLIEKQTNGDVDIDSDGDGSVKIKTKDGSATFGGTEVPEGWPAEVELPDDLEIQSGTKVDTSEGLLVSVNGFTSQTPDELLDFYKSVLSGWNISGETTSTVGGTTLTGAQWENGQSRVTLSATEGEDGKSVVSIAHTTLN